MPGPAPAVAALAVAPAYRAGRAEGTCERWRQERGLRVQQWSLQRSETPREPAVRSDVPAVPERPRRNEADPAGVAPVPVSETIQLVGSLRDLPLEVRSAVLLRVFGRVADSNPDAGQ